MTEDLDELLDYLQKAGLNTMCIGSPVWNLLCSKKVDKTMNSKSKKIVDKTIELESGQKMTVGVLVRHRTVPQLGLGVVVAESEKHKGYWYVKWCDERYQDVGSMGIEEGYLEIL